MCIVTHWKLAKMQILGLKPRDPGNSNVDSPRPNFEKHQFTVWKQILQIKMCLWKLQLLCFWKEEMWSSNSLMVLKSARLKKHTQTEREEKRYRTGTMPWFHEERMTCDIKFRQLGKGKAWAIYYTKRSFMDNWENHLLLQQEWEKCQSKSHG